MNAPFDPGAIADAATRAVEAGLGPLVLSPVAPLESARQLIRRRYTQPAGRTIHHQQGTFYVWCGTHYRDTSREEIRSGIYEFLDSARRMDDDKLVPFNPNRSKVGDVLEALAAAAQLPGTVRTPTWLDSESHPSPADIFACSNGLLHLPTRTLLDHTPSFFGVNAVDYRHDKHAGAPVEWLRFLKSLWPDDSGSIATLQELFGLLLTPDTTYQKAFLLIGPKRSGKGTIARVLIGLLGRENVAGPTLSALSQNFGLATLIGKPLAIISDARLGGRTDAQVIVERLLAITGEDSLSIDRKFLPAWNGQLPTRFLMLSNELPKLSDASGAIASRFIVLRSSKSFFGKEDLALTATLLTELPPILGWAIDGRERLARRGYFLQPTSAKEALQEMADLASPIGAFLRERCKVGAAYSVECDRLYSAWSAWCEQQHRDHPGTKQTFGRDLRSVVPALEVKQPREESGKRSRIYQGVGLIAPNSDEAAATQAGPPPGRFPDDDWHDDGKNPAW